MAIDYYNTSKMGARYTVSDYLIKVYADEQRLEELMAQVLHNLKVALADRVVEELFDSGKQWLIKFGEVKEYRDYIHQVTDYVITLYVKGVTEYLFETPSPVVIGDIETNADSYDTLHAIESRDKLPTQAEIEDYVNRLEWQCAYCHTPYSPKEYNQCPRCGGGRPTQDEINKR